MFCKRRYCSAILTDNWRAFNCAVEVLKLHREPRISELFIFVIALKCDRKLESAVDHAMSGRVI